MQRKRRALSPYGDEKNSSIVKPSFDVTAYLIDWRGAGVFVEKHSFAIVRSTHGYDT